MTSNDPSACPEASVVTNDELIAFCRNYRWTAPLLAYLPELNVTSVRMAAFKLDVSGAVQRRLAANSAPNLARSSIVRSEKRSERERVIRRVYESCQADRTRKLVDRINEELKRLGQRQYTEATLKKKLAKLFPAQKK